MNPYIGNESQLYGVEEYLLTTGYKNGVKMLRAYNGAGLEMCISLDRNGEIVTLTYKGKNISYLTPNGIRSYTNYIPEGDGWIKHFTAGFLTTCGYQNVGVPCEENGVKYPLHGSINYVPVDHYSYEIESDEIVIKLTILDESIFSYKIKRIRTIRISLTDNIFSFEDHFINRGGEDSPLLILYHMNLGYPLLKEDTILDINYASVSGRNEYSSQYLNTARVFEKPTPNYQERCYYYQIKDKTAMIKVSSPSEKIALSLSYDSKSLPFFTQWKMMGVRDYVLGVEPGNVNPDGYVENKKNGNIVTLKPSQELTYKINFKLEDL